MQREKSDYKTSFIIAALRMRNQCEILPSRCAWDAALRISTFLSS